MSFRILILPITAVLLTSCMVGPNFSTPKSAVENQWVESAAVSKKSPSAADLLWWKKFRDPVLDELIEIAYRNNPTLQIAGVKILQARAELSGSIGNLFPQQQGISAGANYYYLPPNNSGANTPPSALGEALERRVQDSGRGVSFGPNIWTGNAFFSSSWEIDFWGKYRRQIQSDKSKFLSSVAAYDNALVTLIADVANSYVNIRTTQDQIRVNEANVEVQRESLQIAEDRYQAGQTSQLDVEQAKTELAETEAKIPGLQNTLQQAKNGLAVQLGLPPSEVNRLLRPGRLPEAPEKIAAGIPHDLLRRRPDVRQAGLDAASQSAKIGVQVANLLPAFSLTGTFGYTANSQDGAQELVSNLFNWQNSLASGAGSLVMPVFNYGRLINRVRVQDASFQEAVLNYQNTVLNAQKEVENGLSGFRTSKQSVGFLESAVKSAKTTTQLSLERYKDGQTDYTTVLNAEQQQLTVENSLAATRGDVILSLVGVYRSIGGGWELRAGRDVISEQTKAEMQKVVPWGRLMQPATHTPQVSPEDQPVQTPKGRPWLWNLLNINK